MNNNLFVTFEGPDGAGKTTVLKKIAARMQENGKPVLTTREPGGIEIAEKIREIILDPLHTAMDEKTEALLYAASRSQHLAEKVRPALANGEFVLCDRFIDSSLAYQGHARGLGIDGVLAINEFAIGDLMPDLTILFNIEPEAGLKRIHANDANREINRLDIEGLAFHKKVYEGYQILAKRYSNRFRIVNADQPIERVVDDVWRILQNS